MPNLIRQNRGHHPPPLRYPVLRDPGTRLSFRERDIAYLKIIKGENIT